MKKNEIRNELQILNTRRPAEAEVRAAMIVVLQVIQEEGPTATDFGPSPGSPKTKSGRFVGLSTFGSGPLSEPGWNRAIGVFLLAGGASLTCFGSGKPLPRVQILCP